MLREPNNEKLITDACTLRESEDDDDKGQL